MEYSRTRCNLGMSRMDAGEPGRATSTGAGGLVRAAPASTNGFAVAGGLVRATSADTTEFGVANGFVSAAPANTNGFGVAGGLVRAPPADAGGLALVAKSGEAAPGRATENEEANPRPPDISVAAWAASGGDPGLAAREPDFAARIALI